MTHLALFDELNAPHIAAAAHWARHHPDFSLISESLLDFKEAHLYGLRGPESDHSGRYFLYERYADTIADYHPFYQAKWHALNDVMGDFFKSHKPSLEQILVALPDLVNTVFYRSLALMNKQASDFSSDWISKELIQHNVLSTFHPNNTDSDTLRTLAGYRRSLGSSDGMWKRITSRLMPDDQGFNRYTFFDSKPVKLRSIYQDIVDGHYFKDVIGIILNETMSADGHYAPASKQACAVHVTASLFSRLIGRNDIGAGDIRTLCQAKTLSSLSYIDTDYFHEHVAERFTPEDIEAHRTLPGYGSDNRFSDYDAIKDSLTPVQRFNYFLSGHYGDKSTQYAGWAEWRRAIINFALDTGTILTYKEAMALPLQNHFSLKKTQQYSDYVDSLMDINLDQYVDIKTYCSVDEYDDHKNVHTVWIGSQYFTREESKKLFQEKLMNITPIKPCGWSYFFEGFTADFPFPDDASEKSVKSQLFNIVSQFKDIIAEIHKNHHGVGDEVTLNDGFYPLGDVCSLPPGSKHIISKVDDGEAKLVGVIDMIPLSNITIVKKGVPEKQLETSLAAS